MVAGGGVTWLNEGFYVVHCAHRSKGSRTRERGTPMGSPMSLRHPRGGDLNAIDDDVQITAIVWAVVLDKSLQQQL